MFGACLVAAGRARERNKQCGELPGGEPKIVWGGGGLFEYKVQNRKARTEQSISEDGTNVGYSNNVHFDGLRKI